MRVSSSDFYFLFYFFVYVVLIFFTHNVMTYFIVILCMMIVLFHASLDSQICLMQDDKSATCFLLYCQKFIELVRVYGFFLLISFANFFIL